MTRRRPSAALAALLILVTAVGTFRADVSAQVRRLRIRGVHAVSGGGTGSFSETWTVNSSGWITEGLPLAPGILPAGQGLKAGSYTTQSDCQATYPADGSCKHILLTFHATGTGSIAVAPQATPGGTYTPTWPTGTSISFNIASGPGAGSVYTATLPSFTSTNCSMNGALARRCSVVVVPVTGGSTPHPSIHVIFEVTCYVGDACRVGYAFQNIKRSTSTDLMTVTTSGALAGSAIPVDDDGQYIAQSSWPFYTGTRWYRVKTQAALTMGTVRQSGESWIASRVLPRVVGGNLKTYVTTCPGTLEFAGGYRYDSGSGTCTYAEGFGQVESNMGDSEGFDRDELAPFPDWDILYMLTGTEQYRTVGRTNAKQSGGWTEAVDSDGGGENLIYLTTGTNYGDIDTTEGVYAGIGWAADGVCGLKGTNHGGCSRWWPGNATTIDREHIPDSNFIEYLRSGERFYLDQLRFQASWMAFVSYPTYTEVDPYVWAGYSRGRHGALGELNDSEMGRGFARPFRLIARAAWAMPDAKSADRTYFETIVQNNLNAIGRYMDYLNSRTDVNGRTWGGAPYFIIGANPTGHTSDTWQYRRYNTITATAAGTPTVLTVVGDDAGIGAGTNDHGLNTGDYVDLGSMVTSGATALNGEHLQVTRIDATHFSVPITTTASTTNEGMWYAPTGNYLSHWRAAITGWETYWACWTGTYTCTSSIYAFPDGLARAVISMQTCSDYSATPGVTHNFYTVPGHFRGNNYDLYPDCATWESKNVYGGASGDLLEAEAVYNGNVLTYHRGGHSYNPANPNQYYTIYAAPLLVGAQMRGISGAAAAYATLLAATDVTAGLMHRPGFYWTVP